MSHSSEHVDLLPPYLGHRRHAELVFFDVNLVVVAHRALVHALAAHARRRPFHGRPPRKPLLQKPKKIEKEKKKKKSAHSGGGMGSRAAGVHGMAYSRDQARAAGLRPPWPLPPLGTHPRRRTRKVRGAKSVHSCARRNLVLPADSRWREQWRGDCPALSRREWAVLMAGGRVVLYNAAAAPLEEKDKEEDKRDEEEKRDEEKREEKRDEERHTLDFAVAIPSYRLSSFPLLLFAASFVFNFFYVCLSSISFVCGPLSLFSLLHIIKRKLSLQLLWPAPPSCAQALPAVFAC